MKRNEGEEVVLLIKERLGWGLQRLSAIHGQLSVRFTHPWYIYCETFIHLFVLFFVSILDASSSSVERGWRSSIDNESSIDSGSLCLGLFLLQTRHSLKNCDQNGEDYKSLTNPIRLY